MTTNTYLGLFGEKRQLIDLNAPQEVLVIVYGAIFCLAALRNLFELSRGMVKSKRLTLQLYILQAWSFLDFSITLYWLIAPTSIAVQWIRHMTHNIMFWLATVFTLESFKYYLPLSTKLEDYHITWTQVVFSIWFLFVMIVRLSHIPNSQHPLSGWAASLDVPVYVTFVGTVAISATFQMSYVLFLLRRYITESKRSKSSQLSKVIRLQKWVIFLTLYLWASFFLWFLNYVFVNKTSSLFFCLDSISVMNGSVHGLFLPNLFALIIDIAFPPKNKSKSNHWSNENTVPVSHSTVLTTPTVKMTEIS